MPKHYDAEVKFRPRPLHQIIFEQAFNIWFKVDRLPTFRRATVHGQHLPDQDNTSGRGRSSLPQPSGRPRLSAVSDAA
jgi:hypothetical protein